MNDTVLVFDSGAGALSIGLEIKALRPDLNMVLAMDQEQFPYGERSVDQLDSRICEQLEQLCQQWQPSLVVLACNSASTTVLPTLRANLSVPVVGVVPAIKPAAKLSTTRAIGLLATPGTVQRPYTWQLIDDFAGDCEVLSLGTAELATAIEKALREGSEPTALLQELINEFEAAEADCKVKLDTVVLACTHFPLMKAAFQSLKPEWTWIDSGKAIARRVDQLLPTRRPGSGQLQAYILGDKDPNLEKGLAPYGIDSVHYSQASSPSPG